MAGERAYDEIIANRNDAFKTDRRGRRSLQDDTFGCALRSEWHARVGSLREGAPVKRVRESAIQ